MSFPEELSNAIDSVTEIVAAHLNNLEAKVGIDNSAVTTSLDYLLKNVASIDPGHKHTAGALSGGNDGEVFYKAAGAWGPGTPEAAGLVAKSGDQSIDGVKTFTTIPIGPASNPTTDNQLARKAYVDLMLPLAGGNMAGNIAMNNHKFNGLAAASGTGEAVRYDEWIAAQDPGHKHSALWASDGSPQAVWVNSLGNVSLGIETPATQLHIFKRDDTGAATGMPEIRIEHQDIRNIGQSGTNGGKINFHNVQRDNTGWPADSIWGEIGFYPSQPTSGNAQIGAKILAAADGSLGGTTTSSYLSFLTTSGETLSERMRILSNGKVGINTTNPGYLLTCNGEPGANGYTAWTNYSDIRFKQDITPLKNNILAKVLKLNPVTFSYNDKNPWGEKPGERRLYGFIAQELQELFPDMVGEAKGPDGEEYLTTNLSNLTLYLVQAIKEQQTQIEAFQAKLN
ncbi:MAG: tail fiber domain-containing protein [Thermodesulfobacteriota bacterium]